MKKTYLRISPEVEAALAENRPVVALESTIISHGMPYPQNVETALEVDRIIREKDVVPATIGVIHGEIIVGMARDEITYMGKAGLAVRKLSRRDMGAAVALGLDGATTSAATSIIAHLAGIRIFATGGLGGVHRGAPESFDISADLDEIARTPVLTVCAGPKAILDIPLTLEYLETKGVPVVSYRSDRLPAFYSSQSPYSPDYRLDDPADIARIFHLQQEMGLSNGMLVCNPVPGQYEIPQEEINPVIEQAVREAEEKGIHGKDSTPFLLDRVKQITGGRSLDTNIQLVYNNVRLASEIAKALAALSAGEL